MARGDLGRSVPQTAEDAEITLGVLSAIEADSDISQRTLSNELGVALGLANAYLKRCVRKGYVKITAVPRRRYTYYLTPQGFAEKARLTGEYLTSSLQFFRRARQQIDAIMEECSVKGYRHIALVGASEIAEIATLTAHDHDVKIVGLVDASYAKSKFCGLPVGKRLADLGRVDAVIVTSTANIERLTEELSIVVGMDRVIVPEFIQPSQIRKGGKKSRRNGVESAGASKSA